MSAVFGARVMGAFWPILGAMSLPSIFNGNLKSRRAGSDGPMLCGLKI